MIVDKAPVSFELERSPKSDDAEQEKGRTQKLTLSQQVRSHS